MHVAVGELGRGPRSETHGVARPRPDDERELSVVADHAGAQALGASTEARRRASLGSVPGWQRPRQLRARARIALYVFLGTVLTTLVVSLIMPKQYTASTAVVIDVKSPDPVAGMVLPGLMTPGYMATQVDIINSDRVAQRVVKLLKLDENPTIKEQWQDATEGKGSLTVWLGNLLQKKLDVKPSRESNVININFSGADPGFAAAIANAFARAYVDVNLELKVEPARQYHVLVDELVPRHRKRGRPDRPPSPVLSQK